MSVKRIVDTNFWNDDKVIEQFSPEDKLFMLYILTNPHTSQLGIYKINKKIMAFELGYSLDTISVLIERFENKYKIIKYSNETNEIAIKNYLKYSVIKGGKPVEDCIKKDLNLVKNKNLIAYVFKNIKDSEQLNETIKTIIDSYDNDNDNDNEVSYPVSYDDTYHDTSNPKNNFEEEFNRLWKKYPNKQGRKDALRHYISARKKKVSYEIVDKGIDNYIEHIQKVGTQKQYIMHGSTWFNGEHWNDEYEVSIEADDGYYTRYEDIQHLL